MTLGIVQTSVLIDRGFKPHYGSEQPVTGKVRLTHRPKGKSTVHELFGPLKVTINFWGRAKTKITVSRGQNGSTNYRGRAPLFSKHSTIYDGPMKTAAEENFDVPFSVTFPDKVQNGGSQFQPSGTWETENGHPLPPTGFMGSSGFGSNFDAFVEYNITAHVEMKGIDVEIPKNTYGRVNYQPLCTLEPSAFKVYQSVTRKVTVQNKGLLPPEERPSGFRQKTKAALSSNKYPVFPLSATVLVPKHLQAGQRIRTIIQLQPDRNDPAWSVNNAPPVNLISLAVKLTAGTSARAEKSFSSEHTDGDSDKVYKCSKLFYDPIKPKDTAQSDIFLDESNDWTANLSSDPTPTNLIPSFKTYNIVHVYSALVEATLRCGDEKFDCSAMRAITVYAAGPAAGTSTTKAPSPGQKYTARPPSHEGEHASSHVREQLPSYAGTGDTTLLEAAPSRSPPVELNGSPRILAKG